MLTTGRMIALACTILMPTLVTAFAQELPAPTAGDPYKSFADGYWEARSEGVCTRSII
jgi:hypothetical protein